MGKIFLTSDLHFGHDREFIYGPRGFKSVDEQDTAIIENWNSIVSDEDDVYILGDLMLNDNIHGIECLKKLKGKKHIIYGNHDTETRKALYAEIGECIGWATVIKYKKYHFYLSHYPTLTGNLDDCNKSMKEKVINLCGHSHASNKFQDADKGFIYHCELDAHANFPVALNDILEDCINLFGQN